MVLLSKRMLRTTIHLALAFACLVGPSLTHAQTASAPALARVLKCVARDGAVRFATAPVPGLACAPLGQPAASPEPAGKATGLRGEIYSFEVAGRHVFATQLPPGIDVRNVRVIRYTFIQTCFACGASEAEFRSVHVNRTAFAATIQAAAQTFGVEEALIRAIAHAESAYVPDAISRAGAQGVMQLMPATAQRFGVSNTLDPTQNIWGGTQYLAWLVHRYPNRLDYAIAAYNAGEGAVDRYHGIPPFAETQRYVRRVAQLLAAYRRQP